MSIYMGELRHAIQSNGPLAQVAGRGNSRGKGGPGGGGSKGGPGSSGGSNRSNRWQWWGEQQGQLQWELTGHRRLTVFELPL
jgi:hypothetical protein